jgi:hypothetical protein
MGESVAGGGQRRWDPGVLGAASSGVEARLEEVAHASIADL